MVTLRAICGYGHFLSDPLARVSSPLQSKKAGLFLHEFAVNDSSALRVSNPTTHPPW